MLFLSAKCKDTLTVLLISIVVLLMPLFAYVAMGATWLSTILPSAGIGMPVSYTHLQHFCVKSGRTVEYDISGGIIKENINRNLQEV